MSISPHVCFLFAQLFYFSALVVKPSPYRPLFMLPVTLATIYFFHSALQVHSQLGYVYACGALSQFFVASSHILIIDVQRQLFKKGQKEPAFGFSLLERIKWAVSLNINGRGIGWSFEPKHALPPPPSSSITRTMFVLQELRALAWDVAWYELFMTYAKSSPSFMVDGYSLGADGIFWRVVNVLGVGISAIITLRAPHRVLGIFCVLTGIFEPQKWVPLFGSLFDAYTLRNFWGRTWHQLLRMLAISHGRFVAYDILHLKRKSKAAYQVQVYISFAVTGLIHVAGDYAFLGYLTHKHALRFFLLQPVAMSFEVLVIEVAKKLSIRGSQWHIIGYLWVVLWFAYTVPGWMDPLFREGIAEAAPYFGVLSALVRS